MEDLSQDMLKPNCCGTVAEVKVYSERQQLSNGDCISKGFESLLPERIFLELKQNDLSDLVHIWDQWGKTGLQTKFEGKYGNIAHLLRIKVDENMIRAAVQFWDPSYRCFVFNEVDMTPTLEEYSALLGFERKGVYWVYKRDGKVSYKKKLAKLLEIDTQTVELHVKNKGKTRCIPWDILKGFILRHMEDEKGMAVMALSIYGLVLFPKVLGHVEVSVIDLFERIEHKTSPEPSVIAETLRSLSFCRQNGGRFAGCAQLLYVWLKSHFKSEHNAFLKPFYKNYPLLEFVKSKWSDLGSKENWIEFFSNLKGSDIIWKAPWMPIDSMIYMCGEYSWVPLLGPWGGIGYAPLMVSRQFGAKQFIPMTYGLQESEFTYGEFEAISKTMKWVNAWSSAYLVRHEGHVDKAWPEYVVWQRHRGKDVKIAQIARPTPLSALQIAPSDVELERQKFEEERLEWTRQAGEFQRQIKAWDEKVAEGELKLRESRHECEREKGKRIDLEKSFEEMRVQRDAAREKAQQCQDKVDYGNKKSKEAKELRVDKLELQRQLRECMRRNDDLEKYLTEKERENQELRERLVRKDHYIEGQEIDLWNTQEKKRKLQEENNSLRAAVKEWRHKCDLTAQISQAKQVELETTLQNVHQKYDLLFKAKKAELERMQNEQDATTIELREVKEHDEYLVAELWKVEKFVIDIQKEVLKMANEARELQFLTLIWPSENKDRRDMQDKLFKFLGKTHKHYMRVLI